MQDKASAKYRTIAPGVRMGNWLVLSEAEPKRSGDRRWNCRCACGVEQVIDQNYLRRRRVSRCECARKRNAFAAKAITPGTMFGRWRVIGPDFSQDRTTYACECECGEQKVVSADALLRGASRSCGCLKRKIVHSMGFGYTAPLRQHDKPRDMHTCDNCRSEFDGQKDGLVTMNRGRVAAAICGGCCQHAKKVKIVYARGNIGGFTYDQFSAIETLKAAG